MSNNSTSGNNIYIKRFWQIIAAGFLFVVLLISSIGLGLFGELPTFRDLENPKSSLASEVISTDGQVLGAYYIQNRSNTKFKDLSPNLINALIATDDQFPVLGIVQLVKVSE